MFFPSLPFMGVMLFPSFWLGNASEGGGGGGGGGGGVVHPLRCNPCFPLVFLPLFYTSPIFFSFLLSFSTAFSSASSSFSLSLCPHLFFFSLLLLLVFFSLCISPLSPFPLFFLRELFVLSTFQDVNEDTIDCNRV